MRPQAAWSTAARAIAADVLAGLPVGASRDARVQGAMTALLSLPALQQAHVSCVVADGDGRVIVDHLGAEPTNPCSNAKIVTASFALSVLGPMHRFKTRIVRVDDDTVAIQGNFDPSLTSADIAAIAGHLRQQGLQSIPRLLLDTSALSGSNVPASFANYGDEDWEYLARPEPLSVDKNIVKLTVTPGSNGHDGVVVADTGAHAIRARVQTVAAGTAFKLGCNDADNGGVLERSGGKPILDVWGTIAADYHKGKTLVMKSPAPLEQVAFAWRDAFERAGITVGDVDISGAPVSGTTMHEHASKPLSTLLQTSVSTSNAFDHEMFALAAAHAQHGGPVSLPQTAAALTAFLHELGTDGVVVNGSGIGNESLVPASAIVQLLAQATTDARRHPLVAALARPGQTGTLKGRLLDSRAEGSFAGKTGTGEGALALSGICGDVGEGGGNGRVLMSLLVDQMKSKRDDVRAVLDATAIVLSTLS